jgi:hypothetical protein
MITGRLPFPDAKGPAGLITAQLKQTPLPPSQANPKANLPALADRVILKCLEKDKNNRYPDVTAMAAGLQEVIDAARNEQSNVIVTPVPSHASGRLPAGADLLETRRGDLPQMAPPPMPSGQPMGHLPGMGPGGPPMGHMGPMGHPGASMTGMPPAGASMGMHGAPMGGYPQAPPNHAVDHVGPLMTYPQAHPHMYPTGAITEVKTGGRKWIWWVVGLLVLGAGAGAVLALIMQ